jgi:hypothetical protein
MVEGPISGGILISGVSFAPIGKDMRGASGLARIVLKVFGNDLIFDYW